jgi:hypothetical protein
LNKEFAKSIPNIDFSQVDVIDQHPKKKLDQWIRVKMPEAGCKNIDVFSLFNACLALLAYDCSFLNFNLNPENAMRCSSF